MFAVILGGFIFKISIMEWLLCLIAFALVVTSELFNTAIEEAVNLAMPKINTKAKIAKDTAASGVLFSAMIAFIIGLCIFLPKILKG